jgi:RimJ/RimL family protein N-acetyltransferase
MDVTLREVRDGDLTAFYAQMNGPEAMWMAAFTAKDPSDPAWFDAHWARIRHDPEVIARTAVGENGGAPGHLLDRA